MKNLATSAANKEKKTKSFMSRFSKILHWFEFFVATFSAIIVLIGFVAILNEIFHIYDIIEDINLHDVLEKLLSDILLLVVGVELAIMLIRRTPESLVEVMFFVIARKMLIKTDTFWDLLIGVAALAALFAIRKYLEYIPPEQRERHSD